MLYPFFEQQSLQEVINQSNESHTILSLVAKAKWAFQIASAMAAVHSSGQYHMDLKPSNMLLNNENDVVVIDWEQCDASPFFLAPEASGVWDVEDVESTERGERQERVRRLGYTDSHLDPPNTTNEPFQIDFVTSIGDEADRTTSRCTIPHLLGRRMHPILPALSCLNT
jgi:serine/threonine protein kinase